MKMRFPATKASGGEGLAGGTVVRRLGPRAGSSSWWSWPVHERTLDEEGELINIGLGSGAALSIFNDAILDGRH